jgi:cysteine desulfurase/selenocysteine lyase
MKKNDFPIFKNNPKLIFLDTAASAQKPQIMLDALTEIYTKNYANVHRGSYFLSEKSTKLYENSRKIVKNFIKAEFNSEIIFTKNATESINLICLGLENSNYFKKGDEIILSNMEHHSNLIPFQILANKLNLKIKYLKFNQDKELSLENFKKLITKKTKFLSLTHLSNIFGTLNPVKDFIKIAKKNNILTLIDGCQAIPHLSVNVQALDCDFYVFSSHKVYGPSAGGVLYGKKENLEKIPYLFTGGGMIKDANLSNFHTHLLPEKLEAGTPLIAEIHALSQVLLYLEKINLEKIKKHDQGLVKYCLEKLEEISEIKIYSSKKSLGLVSFTVKNCSDYDIGDELGENNICVRVGQHCAHPAFLELDTNTLIRVSFGIYNEKKDIDIFIKELKKIIKLYQ